MISGVYKIINIINGKVYIGSSLNIKRRFRQHRKSLLRNKHINVYLQNSWNKYGETNFSFEIIEIIAPENLMQKEQYYLDLFKSYNKKIGYNIMKIAGGGDTLSNHPNKKQIFKKVRRGLKKWRANLSETEKIEINKKISISLKGRVFSSEHRKRKSRAQTGNKNHQYGKSWTTERRKKLSENRKGRNLCQIMRKICIEGVVYDSITEACIALNISRGKIKGRCDSNSIKYINYYYLNKPKQKLEQLALVEDCNLPV